MAAQPWTVYTNALKKIGNGTIALDGNFRMALFQSASDAATAATSLLGDLSSQVAEANGYSSSGKSLGTAVWTVSGAAVKFDGSAGADPIWTATGGTIPNVKFAVIFASGASAGLCHVLCYSSLTSSQFTLASGNTLTVQLASTGIFTMANA